MTGRTTNIVAHEISGGIAIGRGSIANGKGAPHASHGSHDEANEVLSQKTEMNTSQPGEQTFRDLVLGVVASIIASGVLAALGLLFFHHN